VLRRQGRFRDLLFTVGVNTALRISDLLRLQIGQFLDDRGRNKPRFWIHEQKRNKCHEVVLPGNFGTHSLRKTWGYHARIQGVDLTFIMHKLNYESIAYTKRYLGITDDELQAVAQRLNL